MPDPTYPRVAAHPLHTILAAFPIAFFTGAVVTDITYANTYEMQWANFSVWMITGGLVMFVLAGLAGIVDALWNRKRRLPRPGWPHSLGMLIVFVVEVFNALVHSRDAYTSVMPTGLILSVIGAVLVLVVSWIGTSAYVRGDARVVPASDYREGVR